jgi:hypothetical protein
LLLSTNQLLVLTVAGATLRPALLWPILSRSLLDSLFAGWFRRTRWTNFLLAHLLLTLLFAHLLLPHLVLFLTATLLLHLLLLDDLPLAHLLLLP